MHVTMVMVASADGKTTQGDDPNIYRWTSAEDSQLFFSLIDQYRLIVMGSQTYQSVKPMIKLRPDKLRVVMTQRPEEFAGKTVPGSLEFSSEPPPELVTRLESVGYTELLLVGGSRINGAFLAANLVDELQLTIEPMLFGSGKNLVEGVDIEQKLTLVRQAQLNQRGTLQLIYQIDQQN